ncbi:predicted protein, partial [Arabidopsis lyrata subsp. lyrata]
FSFKPVEERGEFGCYWYIQAGKYVIISTKESTPKLYGTKAINVWDPALRKRAEEMSISKIWIASGQYKSGDLNTVEVDSGRAYMKRK